MQDTAVEIPRTFRTEEAVSWLRAVDGEIYRAPTGRRDDRAWVAVVRTPRFGDQRGQLIIALGDSALEAAHAAASQWRAVWDRIPRGA